MAVKSVFKAYAWLYFGSAVEGAFLGLSQVLLKQNNLTPKQQNKLAIIHRSVNQLLSGIQEVLHLSQIEVGNTTFCAQTQALH